MHIYWMRRSGKDSSSCHDNIMASSLNNKLGRQGLIKKKKKKNNQKSIKE